MKRAALILIPLILGVSLFAQEPKPKDQNEPAPRATVLKSRVFEIHHQDPRAIARSIALLGSGIPGTAHDVNTELDTITVRDFPENLATIEEAIRRLDVPSPARPSIELHLYVLVGSHTPNGSRDLPPELVDVVAQLKSTLRYAEYSLMTSAIHRTTSGEGIESSGVAANDLVGFKGPVGSPLIYSYTFRRIALAGGEIARIDVDALRFTMRIPIPLGDSTQYSDVGFETPVTIREGEKVVVGTTAMGDRALIVVVTATIARPQD